MITSKTVNNFFGYLVTEPSKVLTFVFLAFLFTFSIGQRYEKLKNQPLHLEPPHNRLSEISRSLRDDFREEGPPPPPDGIIVWCSECNLAEEPAFQNVIETVEAILLNIKAHTRSCETLSWQISNDSMRTLISDDGTAAALPVMRSEKLELNQVSECILTIHSQLENVDRRYGGLRVGLGTPFAVGMLTANEELRNVMRRIGISVPFLSLLLWLYAGSVLRALTPMLCMTCSFVGTRAVLVVVKVFWRNFNFPTPEAVVTTTFVELALALDYGVVFWGRFRQERGQRPDREDFVPCLLLTLKASGLVVLTSAVVLEVGFVGLSFYPDVNETGILAFNLHLMSSVAMVAFHSITLPAALAAYFPHSFDEARRMHPIGPTMGQKFFRWFSARAIGWPWVILLPLVAYSCMVPCLGQLRYYKPNYNVMESMLAPDLAGFEAYQVYKGRFANKPVLPVAVLLQATPMGHVWFPIRPNDMLLRQENRLKGRTAERRSRDEANSIRSIDVEDRTGTGWPTDDGQLQGLAAPTLVAQQLAAKPLVRTPRPWGVRLPTHEYQNSTGWSPQGPAESQVEVLPGVLIDRKTLRGAYQNSLRGAIRVLQAAAAGAAAGAAGAVAAAGLQPFRYDQVGLTPQFRGLTCQFAQSVIKATKGRPFEVRAEDIDAVWWDPEMRACSLHPRLRTAPPISLDGTKQVLMMYPAADPLGLAAQELTKLLWDDIEPEARRQFDYGGEPYKFEAQHVSVIGQIMLIDERMAARAPWIMLGTVLGICFVMGWIFRSVGVGFKVLLSVVLPILADYGFLVAAWQSGWLEWAGLIPSGGVLYFMIYTTFGFLLGLAIDYDVVLFARVYERRMEGYDNTSAVRLGLMETGPMVTLAGTMMTLSFLVMCFDELPMVRQLATLYCFGVAVDTYIVRTCIAPTVLCLAGQLNYWPARMPPETKSFNPLSGDSSSCSIPGLRRSEP